jgi:aspartyl/asparaginyl beta-hydroxylase (cupin superfamily)
VRGHLGIVVPDGLPACGLEVDGEARGWQTGRMLLFCDAYNHRAWNRGRSPRLVMIIDVMLPEHRAALRSVCAFVLGSLLIFRVEARLRKALGKRAPATLPPRVRMPLHKLFSLGWRAYLPIQPRLRWLPPR